MELDKVITVSVICLSASVAWATFGLTWRENYLERHTKKLNILKRLLNELDRIGIWASGRYDESSHSDNWFNPYWNVTNFDFKEIRSFNWAENAAFFGEEIFTKLLPLEKAIYHFYECLLNQKDLIQRRNSQFVNNIAQKICNEKKRINKEMINPIEIKGQNELSLEEKDFVKNCYELNKSIHVDGIGNENTPGKLHFTFNEAHGYVKESLEKVRKSRPILLWLVNFLALVVAIIGLVFLGLFFYRVLPSTIWWFNESIFESILTILKD